MMPLFTVMNHGRVEAGDIVEAVHLAGVPEGVPTKVRRSDRSDPGGGYRVNRRWTTVTLTPRTALPAGLAAREEERRE